MATAIRGAAAQWMVTRNDARCGPGRHSPYNQSGYCAIRGAAAHINKGWSRGMMLDVVPDDTIPTARVATAIRGAAAHINKGWSRGGKEQDVRCSSGRHHSELPQRSDYLVILG